jgi:hypothetical protein
VTVRFTRDHLLALGFLLDGRLMARKPLFHLLLQTGGLESILLFFGNANDAPVQPSASPTAKIRKNQTLLESNPA